ncbi:MAG: hypothetical protein R3222_05665 [Balneolaceae bacterium]|nr:hypothetical protein [Balneolaceae bacterium]
MSQQKIPFSPGFTYHLWAHANGSEDLFRTDDNYRYFLQRYNYFIYPVAETFAYCLMPNHLHLMIRVRSEREVLRYLRVKKGDPNFQDFESLGGFSSVISQQFSNLFNGYAQSYNHKFERKGSLFIPNFKRKLIDSDEYLASLVAYIHNNPVHHGFVKKPGDWPFSSWQSYLINQNLPINKQEGLQWFGGRETFRKAHQEVNVSKLKSVFEE